MADRLTEMEIRFTYQEDTIESLNQVVIRQQEQLHRLERRVATLEEQLVAANGESS